MYEWIKALHIIFFISWMVSLLYLPRLYVYHCNVSPESDQDRLFITMERRLLTFIATPALLATWIFGLWLMILTQAWSFPWFHTKILLVALLTGFHGVLKRWGRDFATGRRNHEARFFRIANEIPTVLMVCVVIIVVVKPF